MSIYSRQTQIICALRVIPSHEFLLFTGNNKSKFIFIQQVECSLPLKNQLLHRAGFQARALIYFYILFTRAAI